MPTVDTIESLRQLRNHVHDMPALPRNVKPSLLRFLTTSGQGARADQYPNWGTDHSPIGVLSIPQLGYHPHPPEGQLELAAEATNKSGTYRQ